MHISRVIIYNYRNLKHVDIKINNIVTLVGENNSGKSNFLKAIALPLSSDDGDSKRLSWYDINKEERERYYDFIKDNLEDIKNGKITEKEFAEHLPVVSVELYIQPEENEHRDISKILCETEGKFVGGIQYRFSIEKPKELLLSVKEMLNSENAGNGDDFQKSLLPISAFKTTIIIPGKESDVPYDVRTMFKTVDLPAERDTFSGNMDRLGSKALIDVLQENLAVQSKVKIEQEYTKFFETIKTEAKFDSVLNWQDYSDISNAKEFFDEISVLPNMPQFGSILGNVKLGYEEEPMFIQGLGHRNMILMMILLNSYLNRSHNISLRAVTLEEPEAHLSTNNILLMASFFKKFNETNKYTQLFFSTHSTEFVNKIGFENVIFVHKGNVFSLKSQLSSEQLDYLTKNPNTDIFKMFYSSRTILVEGISEELLIKSYLITKPELNNIKVISFHKGYTKIIEIWKMLNQGGNSKLGVVRDYDDQPNAQLIHERLQDSQVIVRTTKTKTLEPEILKSGNNYDLLKTKYGNEYGWEDKTAETIADEWSKKKTDVMLRICQDLINGNLQGFTMPKHISEIIDFMLE